MTIAERLRQEGYPEEYVVTYIQAYILGYMKGILEERQTIAQRLWNMGMTPEQIKQATRISEDELKKITH
ncbi:hypothetical protein DRL16_22140 [Salmonella enterica subsp. enterica serovar Bredeney]|nr:hypothetical protein [Salmonella enterica subsp. enterica serovar Bredeney]EBY2599562.1 hypothetical protein [Salmonella enterica subsp. enterica serovar Bredeney]EEM9512485.1 hypothetical protein [Salmonella enterica]